MKSYLNILFFMALSCLLISPMDTKAAALGANPEIDQDIKNDEEQALQDRQEVDSESNPDTPDIQAEYQKKLFGVGGEEHDAGRGTNQGVQLYTAENSTDQRYQNASYQHNPERIIKAKDGTLSCKFQYNNEPAQSGFTKATYRVQQAQEQQAAANTPFTLEAILASFGPFNKSQHGTGSRSHLDFDLASVIPGMPLPGAVVPGMTSMPEKLAEVIAGSRSKPGQVLGMAQPSLKAGNEVINKITAKYNQWKMNDPQASVQARKKPQKNLNSGSPKGKVKDNDDNGTCQERAGQVGNCTAGG